MYYLHVHGIKHGVTGLHTYGRMCASATMRQCLAGKQVFLAMKMSNNINLLK